MSTTAATSTINPSSQYQDGLAFRFKLDQGTGLALRSVTIENGIPKLAFSTSHKVPSICEEDVATCVRLAMDCKRPEFFYTGFDDHPFVTLGRWYKSYRPTYLRGNSVGELFAEADWHMKCLNVGVKSDESKKVFQSWPESSLLDGLETRDRFPSDKEAGQVLMICKSVDVSESDNELVFVGEPKMGIKYTASSSYTSYLTEHFDSIAYHDQPVFLKMKEIVKLVLAAEWLRDKGIKFSNDWIQQHTKKPKNNSRKPVKVELSNEKKNLILQQLQEKVDSAVKQLPPVIELDDPPSIEIDIVRPSMSLKAADVKCLESGLEFSLETTHAEPLFKALTGLNIPVVTKLEARVTVDDFNFLYKGLDPNQPVTIDVDPEEKKLELLSPDVSSWSELYAETEPPPCKMVEDLETGKTTEIITGGCTTANIPVRKTVPPTTPLNRTAHVTASTARKAQKVVPSRSVEQSCPPPKDIRRACNGESAAVVMKGTREVFGWKDTGSCSMSTSKGTPAKQQPSMHSFVKVTQLIGGKEYGPSIELHMHLRPPHQEKITQLIGGKEVGVPIMADMHLRNGPKAIDCKMETESPVDSAYSSTRSLITN